MKAIDRLIVALDLNSEEKAAAMAEQLKNDVKLFKIGLELFSASGPALVNRIKDFGCGIFLDLKFHDIPTTVGKAASAIVRLEPFMFNVHALGGFDMMKRTAEMVGEEASRAGVAKPKILAVTVLTSMDEKALGAVGISGAPQEAVLRLARLAKQAGLDGVVASPSEVKAIRKELGEEFMIVTPGVRPLWAAVNDQKRIATPAAAIKDGADYIVVGRPITESKNPAEAAREILKEMGI